MADQECIELVILAQVERCVRDVFEKRFAGRQMPYEMARELVWLEREIMENVGAELRLKPEPPDVLATYARDVERLNTRMKRGEDPHA